MFAIIYIEKKQVSLIMTDVENIEGYNGLRDLYDIEEKIINLSDSVEVYRNGSKHISKISAIDLNMDTDLLISDGTVYKIIHFMEV